MSKLFKKLVVDVENGKTFKEVGNTSEDKCGHHRLHIFDEYGNEYFFRHEVVMAEGLNLPKHLWPKDSFGRTYIVDHIIPISNGGTDEFENLRLIPKQDNPRNVKTMENMTHFKGKDKYNKMDCINEEGEIVKTYNSANEIRKDGFNYHTVRKSILRRNKTSGLYFKRH